MPDGLDWSAPDVCSYHDYWLKEFVQLNKDGSCPKQLEHSEYGPAAG